LKKAVYVLCFIAAVTASCAAEGKARPGGGAVRNEGDRSLKASHADLAFGTRIKVTNADNNKSVIVTINGRIPDDPGGVVLSVGTLAADNIGMGRGGVTPVIIEVLGRKKWPESYARPGIVKGEEGKSEE
jgi:rare lipoprotein A